MPHPPIPQFVRADHEALLRRWILEVFERERLKTASFVTKANTWLEENAHSDPKPTRNGKRRRYTQLNRGTLDRFVYEKNKSSTSRLEMRPLWNFLWAHYFQYCPPELRESLDADASSPDPDIDVSGRWTITFLEKHVRDVTLEIEQNGHRLRGVSTHRKNTNEIGGDEQRKYDLQGRLYKERFVLLNGISQHPKRIAINTFLFEIVGAGHKMTGAVAAYNTEDGGEIFTRKCECVRVA